MLKRLSYVLRVSPERGSGSIPRVAPETHIQRATGRTGGARRVRRATRPLLSALFGCAVVTTQAIAAPEQSAVHVMNTCFSDSAHFDSRLQTFRDLGWQVAQQSQLDLISDRLAGTFFVQMFPSERHPEALKRMLANARAMMGNAVRQNIGSYAKTAVLLFPPDETVVLLMTWVDNATSQDLTCNYVSDNPTAGLDLLAAITKKEVKMDTDLKHMHFTRDFPDAHPQSQATASITIKDKASFEALIDEPLFSVYGLTVAVEAKQ